MSEGKATISKQKKGDDLPVPWQRIQSAVWLFGLALIAWQDWWWPGILVLAAVSGLVQAAIQVYLSRQSRIKEDNAQQDTLNLERADWLPDVCPKCGGPVSVGTVNWTGSNTADCPYCKANLKKPD